jgi:DNA-directed RNA polymerase subunit beta
MDNEEILHTFYDAVTVTSTKDGWRMPFAPERYRGIKPTVDLIDAKSKKVVVEAGTKITAAPGPQAGRRGAQGDCWCPTKTLHGMFLAR